MVIAKLKVDERGRLQFPQSFLKGNGITIETEIEVHIMQGLAMNDSVKLVFKGIKEDKDNEEL